MKIKNPCAACLHWTIGEYCSLCTQRIRTSEAEWKQPERKA